jgi:hypothetical protein
LIWIKDGPCYQACCDKNGGQHASTGRNGFSGNYRKVTLIDP